MVGRVVEQVVDRAGQTLGNAVDDDGLERALEPHIGEVAARARERVGDDAIEPDVLGRGDRKVAAGKLDHVSDQRAQLLALLEHVREQPVPVSLRKRVAGHQHLDVRAQARDRCAELVGGVGHELALGLHRLVERGSGALQSLDHRVEARGKLPDLIVGVVLDAAGQVLGVGDVLRGLGHLGERRQHALGRQPPETGGERDPARAQQQQDHAQLGQHVVHRRERPGELQRRRHRTERVADADRHGQLPRTTVPPRFTSWR